MTTDAAFLNWLAGFVDGEGCFMIAPVPNRTRPQFMCKFSLKLRADDGPILEEIRTRVGFGSMSAPRLDFGNADLAGQPSMRWTVLAKSDCVKLVRIFDEYPLRAKKAADFAIWRRAVIHWAAIESANQRSPVAKLASNDWHFSEMGRLRQELRLVRVYRESPEGLAEVAPVEQPEQLWAA